MPLKSFPFLKFTKVYPPVFIEEWLTKERENIIEKFKVKHSVYLSIFACNHRGEEGTERLKTIRCYKNHLMEIYSIYKSDGKTFDIVYDDDDAEFLKDFREFNMLLINTSNMIRYK